MKRTATILGIAAVLGVAPSVASAGNTTQDKPQLRVQVVTQIVKPQPVNSQWVSVARVTSHRYSAFGISLLHIHAR